MPTRRATGSTSRTIASQSTDAEAGALRRAEHDVLEHVHARHQGQFLVDEAEAAARWPACGVSIATGSPSISDRAAIGMLEAGEDADQRRLAGAVGADQAVDLAGGDVEADAGERADAAEGFPDVVRGDEGRASRVPSPGLVRSPWRRQSSSYRRPIFTGRWRPGAP